MVPQRYGRQGEGGGSQWLGRSIDGVMRSRSQRGDVANIFWRFRRHVLSRIRRLEVI